MKTITNIYNSPITPKIWMTALTGVSYLLMCIILFTRFLESVHEMMIVFGVILIPSSLLDMYFSTGNKDKIFSWGFNMLNGIADLLMGVLFILHLSVGNYFILYFGSFWILGKGIVTLNFSSLIKRRKVLKTIYSILSIATITTSMMLITNELFPVFPIREIFAFGLLFCTFNKFISMYLMNKKYY